MLGDTLYVNFSVMDNFVYQQDSINYVNICQVRHSYHDYCQIWTGYWMGNQRF